VGTSKSHAGYAGQFPELTRDSGPLAATLGLTFGRWAGQIMVHRKSSIFPINTGR
jgi:hypothetical protein